jgi:hypothetical protein
MNNVSVVVLLLFASTLVFAQECIITSNSGPRGENRACNDTKKPYCVSRAGISKDSVCSECSPYLTVEESLCDCAPGKICDRNASSEFYGTCQPWPLNGAKCGSQKDCVTTYRDPAGQSYDTVSMICLMGNCRQCDYILNHNLTECTSGTKTGQVLSCEKPGSWVKTGGSPSSSSSSSSIKGIAATTTTLAAIVIMNLFLF